MEHIEFFSFFGTQDQFDKALVQLIQNMVDIERNKLLPPENVMRYRHGTKWVTTSSNISQEEREMKTLETVVEISWKDICDHNLEVLPKYVMTCVKQITESNKKMMLETVSEMCEKTGQTIEGGNDKSPAELYLDVLKKVEFGVDKHGRVSTPFFYPGNPKAYEALIKDVELKGKEFNEKVQKIVNEKSEKALEREKKRFNKFKRKR